MNTQRLLILGVAAIAAGGAALLARGLLGGGTPKVAAAVPSAIATTEVLVASSDLQPGTHLTGANVRWQKWPRSGIDGSLITGQTTSPADTFVNGTVVRSSIVAGEPITMGKVVRTDAAGVMAAMVTPGMRAMSIKVTADSSAAGFIVPNDRVDVILTGHGGDGMNHTVTLLQNIRVLAMDQRQDSSSKPAIATTATLEVAPIQAELLAWGQLTGTITLSLRGLTDSTASSLATTALATSAGAARPNGGAVAIIRYGLGHNSAPPVGE